VVVFEMLEETLQKRGETMSGLSLEYLKENKCRESGCYRFCAKGYTLCPGHLWGFSRMMDEEDLERIKKTERGEVENA
jgi:hypothetical protein